MTFWRLLRDAVLILGIGLFGFAVLYYITQDSEVQAYASIEIIPESLSQQPIVTSDAAAWALHYDLRVLKEVECDEVITERRVHQADSATPVANSTDVSGEIIPASSEVQVVHGFHARLTGPLTPGDYLLVFRSTCNIEDDDVPGMAQLGASAVARICFRVARDAPTPDGIQHLQPIAENCPTEMNGERARARPAGTNSSARR